MLLTTVTVTSAKVMAERLPARAIHQYAPIDHPRAVHRFLDHWRPDLAIWIESEIWPNLIATTADRGVPLQLIQGRLSARSFSALVAVAEAGVPRCCNVSKSAWRRMRRRPNVTAVSGARDVRIMGSLKDVAPPLPADDEELSRLRNVDRWPAVAGSLPARTPTRKGPSPKRCAKSRQRIPMHSPLSRRGHPVRADEAARTFRARGLSVGKRSEGLPAATIEVFVVDTIGELGLGYRVADIAFIGGSLAPHGGHNAMEAVRLGCAVLHGPDMANSRPWPQPCAKRARRSR